MQAITHQNLLEVYTCKPATAAERTKVNPAMGRTLWETFQNLAMGCFAVFEGGHNHQVIGRNVLAFSKGLQGL